MLYSPSGLNFQVERKLLRDALHLFTIPIRAFHITKVIRSTTRSSRLYEFTSVAATNLHLVRELGLIAKAVFIDHKQTITFRIFIQLFPAEVRLKRSSAYIFETSTFGFKRIIKAASTPPYLYCL